MVMQKNWYAVYTKPQSEKKVAALLIKRKIQAFFPLVSIKTTSFGRDKSVFVPLFKSIVFVCATPNDLAVLKQTTGVINILYWLGMPAIITTEEIATIRQFTEDYRNIKLEPSFVNNIDVANNVNGSSVTITGNLFVVKNRTIKVNLPSLGYTMIAQVEEENVFIKESLLLQKNKYAHS